VKIEKTSLPGVLSITPRVFEDNRGYFFENHHESHYKIAGICHKFVQDNISRSSKGVLRGMHYQLKNPQAKLLTVLRGSIFDVALDVRANSPTFGKWYGKVLSDENHSQLYIPEGFAHGFYVLSDIVDIYYKCSSFYNPKDEFGIIWNDPSIGIEWPLLDLNPILSQKDSNNCLLSSINREFLPSGSF